MQCYFHSVHLDAQEKPYLSFKRKGNGGESNYQKALLDNISTRKVARQNHTEEMEKIGN